MHARTFCTNHIINFILPFIDPKAVCLDVAPTCVIVDAEWAIVVLGNGKDIVHAKFCPRDDVFSVEWSVSKSDSVDKEVENDIISFQHSCCSFFSRNL